MQGKKQTAEDFYLRFNKIKRDLDILLFELCSEYQEINGIGSSEGFAFKNVPELKKIEEKIILRIGMDAIAKIEWEK